MHTDDNRDWDDIHHRKNDAHLSKLDSLVIRDLQPAQNDNHAVTWDLGKCNKTFPPSSSIATKPPSSPTLRPESHVPHSESQTSTSAPTRLMPAVATDIGGCCPLVAPTLLVTPARLSFMPVTPQSRRLDIPFSRSSSSPGSTYPSSPHSDAIAAIIPTPPRDAADADASLLPRGGLATSSQFASPNSHSPSFDSPSPITPPSTSSFSSSPTSTSAHSLVSSTAISTSHSSSSPAITATSFSFASGVQSSDNAEAPSSTNSSASHPVGASSSFTAVTSAVSSLYRLDDFHHEKIASGFFSEVFKVTHKFTNEVMVLKLNKDRRNRGNVLKEVQLLKRLDHPNVLKFLGVCVDEGQLHALTEMVDGGNLEELIVKSTDFPAFPWGLRLSLLRETAEGMKYLHSRQIIHRDLTANNIFLRRPPNDAGDGGDAPRFSALIGDFGLAVTKDAVAKDAVTKDSASAEGSRRLPVVGTPFWMAPECLRGDAYDEKIDVFSFGIVICQTLARIDADPDVLPRTQAFGVDQTAFSLKCDGAPPRLLRLALRCCRLDPDKRPPFSRLVELLTHEDSMLAEEPTPEDSDSDTDCASCDR